MSHLPTEQEAYLDKLEDFILDAPFNIKVEISKINADTFAFIPKGFVETENGWRCIIDTEDGMVTKEIVVYI